MRLRTQTIGAWFRYDFPSRVMNDQAVFTRDCDIRVEGEDNMSCISRVLVVYGVKVFWVSGLRGVCGGGEN